MSQSPTEPTTPRPEPTPPAATAGPRPLQTLLLLGIVVTVLVILWVILAQTGKSALNGQLADWKQAGGGASLLEIAPRSLENNAEKNAAVGYVEAFKLLPKLTPPMVLAVSDPLKASAEDLAQAVQLSQPALEKAHQAVHVGFCRWPINYGSLTELEEVRTRVLESANQLVVLIEAEGIHRLRQGDGPNSVESFGEAMALGERLFIDRFLANFTNKLQVHTMAFDLMESAYREQTMPPAPRMVRLLARQDYRKDLTLALRGEGAFTLDVYRSEEFRERLGQSLDAAGRKVPWWYIAPLASHDMACYMKTLQADIVRLEKPWHQRQAQGELPPELPGWTVLAQLGPGQIPGLDMTVTISQTRLNQARLALQLAQIKAEKGKYPESLAEVPEAPVDPFTGQAFEYKAEKEGFILASAGSRGGKRITWQWEK